MAPVTVTLPCSAPRERIPIPSGRGEPRLSFSPRPRFAERCLYLACWQRCPALLPQDGWTLTGIGRLLHMRQGKNAHHESLPSQRVHSELMVYCRVLPPLTGPPRSLRLPGFVPLRPPKVYRTQAYYPAPRQDWPVMTREATPRRCQMSHPARTERKFTGPGSLRPPRGWTPACGVQTSCEAPRTRLRPPSRLDHNPFPSRLTPLSRRTATIY